MSKNALKGIRESKSYRSLPLKYLLAIRVNSRTGYYPGNRSKSVNNSKIIDIPKIT